MDSAATILLVSRLLTVAAAAFLSILLWSRTRDLAWMLVVIGTIASYAEIIFDLLARIGLVDEARYSPFGLPLGRIVLSNLPYLLLCAAFLVMIHRKRVR
jgi:hypothetical protein